MQQFTQDQNALVWLTVNHLRFQVPAEGIEDIINTVLKHDYYHSANVRVIINDSRGGFISTDKQQLYQLQNGWRVLVFEGGSRSGDQGPHRQSDAPNRPRNSSQRSQRGVHVNNGSAYDPTRNHGAVPRNFSAQPSSTSNVRSDDHASTARRQRNEAPHLKIQPISISLTDPLPTPTTGRDYVKVLVTEIPALLWDSDMKEFLGFLRRQKVYRQDVFWIEDANSERHKALLYVARTKADKYMAAIMSPKDEKDRKKNYGMKAEYYK